MNPFSILGFEPRLDLSDAELEAAYLRLSREHHPDRHRSADPAEQAEILSRAADLNDAYRILENRWSRAECLVELEDPGSLEKTKQLSPVFLMQAMELSEAIGEASDERQRAMLASVQEELDGYFERIRGAVAARDFNSAAVWLNESRYYRKAFRELATAEDPRS